MKRLFLNSHSLLIRWYLYVHEGKYPFRTHIQVRFVDVEIVGNKFKKVKKCIFLLGKFLYFFTFENENRVKKGHAQHDKDQFFYNRTYFDRKIFLKDNTNAMDNK